MPVECMLENPPILDSRGQCRPGWVHIQSDYWVVGGRTYSPFEVQPIAGSVWPKPELILNDIFNLANFGSCPSDLECSSVSLECHLVGLECFLAKLTRESW